MHSSLQAGGPNRSSTMSIQPILPSCENALDANEPVFMPQHAPALVGRDAVRADHQPVFATKQPRA